MDESSLLSHPCYHEVWPASLSFAVLIGALWHLSVISLCFSPVTEDIETLSCAYLSSIHFLGRAWDPESQGRGFMSHTEWCVGASLEDQMVLLAVQGTWVWSLSQWYPLEKEMATHSSICAWRIPWTEEPGRLIAHGVAKSQVRPSD